MIFWILVTVIVALLLVAASGAVLAIAKADEDYLGLSAFALIVIVLPGISTLPTWIGHADDLADLRESGRLVSVYSERVDSLEDRLDAFDYPASAMWNKDSPVASIVEALSEAESNLAEAKTIKAKARISIEARANGPMSGIVTILGKE